MRHYHISRRVLFGVILGGVATGLTGCATMERYRDKLEGVFSLNGTTGVVVHKDVAALSESAETQHIHTEWIQDDQMPGWSQRIYYG